MPLRIIKITQTVNSEITDFLSRNLIGTPDKSPVYQQLSTHEKLVHIPRPHFAALYKSERLLSTCCFCERETILDLHPIKSFYVRYFSFLDQLRIKDRKSASGQRKNSLIKSDIHQMLTGTGLGSEMGESNLFYAYVDPNNARSALLCEEFGFQPIRQFTTHIIGILFPSQKVSFEQVKTKEQTVIQQLLREQYAEYSFYTEENLFYHGNYYVVRSEKGEVLVGLQANPEKWKMHSLPGLTGRFLLNLVGRLPVCNRLIQKNYRFLALDYLYVKEGHEDLTIQLIESLLSQFGVYSAMILSDDQSSLSDMISTMDRGLIGRFKKPVSISVIVKGNNLEPSTLNHLKKYPVFLSSFDTT